MRVESFDCSDKLLKEFIDLPWEVYRGDGLWIPPFKKELRRLLSEENPFFQYGAMRSFLAFDGNRPVARCSAIWNKRLRPGGRPVGVVGFYESVRWREGSDAVLSAACQWLQDRGLEEVWGPMNFSIWHSYRLMTNGFGRLPFYGEPYNPSYYPELFDDFGFLPKGRWYSWDLSEAQLLGMRAAATQMARPEILEEGFRLAPIDLDCFEEELEKLHALLVEAFHEHPGYSPIDMGEFQALYSGMRHLVDPELVCFVVSPRGDPVALAYLYPDHSEALRAMNGRSGLLSKFSFFRKTRRGTRRLIFHTMALKKEFRRQGMVETFLAPVFDKAFELGYREAIGALALEGPTVYSKTGAASREYVLYRKEL